MQLAGLLYGAKLLRFVGFPDEPPQRLAAGG